MEREHHHEREYRGKGEVGQGGLLLGFFVMVFSGRSIVLKLEPQGELCVRIGRFTLLTVS